MRVRTALAILAALVSFAANSWLCRAALAGGAIDPVLFTAVRLVAGAAVLLLLSGRQGRDALRGRPWLSSSALFLYAICFSLAYVRLETGTGALALFGAVQVTMLVGGVRAGQRLRAADGAGLLLAFGGLVVLAAPGRSAPDPLALAGMASAGVAWGFYSLRGRGALRPLAENAANFALAAPAALLGALAAGASGPGSATSARGLVLATVSGAVTSGLGYAAWYAALPSLSAVHAGILQLAVPVLAAAGGVVFFDERIALRYLIASLLILGGIALALGVRERAA